MAEINVNITEIDNAITKLHGLLEKNECATPPVTVGGGKSVNELENIANTYMMLNKSFEDLISNTISFLQNVKDSYVSSDKKAAEGIQK